MIAQITIHRPYQLETGENARRFESTLHGCGLIETFRNKYGGQVALATFESDFAPQAIPGKSGNSIHAKDRRVNLEDDAASFDIAVQAINQAIAVKRTEIGRQFLQGIDAGCPSEDIVSKILFDPTLKPLIPNSAGFLNEA